MSVMWRLAKTASRVYGPWRSNLKQYENFFRHDHYYSPIPLPEEIERRREKIFDRGRQAVAGIDLRDEEQLALLDSFRHLAAGDAFPERESSGCRYWLDNKFFPYADGMFLHAMLRHARPQRVVEVGSGFSSAACLDTIDRFFDGQIQCTFIDPDPSRLNRLLAKSANRNATILPQAVQDVPLDAFLQLQRNDILFLDSSHVAKVGSDVNHIFAEILPALAAGVFIHFHDIFYPFEYPEKWIKNGWAWNEAYVLRTFLQFNNAFRIVAWPDYLDRFHHEALHRSLPHCNRTSGSIWIQKVQ